MQIIDEINGLKTRMTALERGIDAVYAERHDGHAVALAGLEREPEGMAVWEDAPAAPSPTFRDEQDDLVVWEEAAVARFREDQEDLAVWEDAPAAPSATFREDQEDLVVWEEAAATRSREDQEDLAVWENTSTAPSASSCDAQGDLALMGEMPAAQSCEAPALDQAASSTPSEQETASVPIRFFDPQSTSMLLVAVVVLTLLALAISYRWF